MSDQLDRLIFLSFQEVALAWIVQKKKAVPVMFFVEDYKDAWEAMKMASSVPVDVPDGTRRSQLSMSPHVHNFNDDQPFFFIKSRSRRQLAEMDISKWFD